MSELPGWLVAPIVGAATMFLIALFRGVLLALTSPGEPAKPLTFGLALVVSVTAGGLAGLAHVVVRRVLSPLGFVGHLLNGAVIGAAYILALLVPAKLLFGDDTLATAQDWLVSSAFGAGFGIAVAVLYLYYRRVYR